MAAWPRGGGVLAEQDGAQHTVDNIDIACRRLEGLKDTSTSWRAG